MAPRLPDEESLFTDPTKFESNDGTKVPDTKKFDELSKKLSDWNRKVRQTENRKEKNEDENDEIMSKVIGFILGVVFIIPFFLLIMVYGLFTQGYVLSHLWAWFVLPLVDKPLPLIHAIGIATVVGFLTHQPQRLYSWYKEHNSDEIPASAKIGYYLMLIATPWITLLIGHIIHRCM